MNKELYIIRHGETDYARSLIADTVMYTHPVTYQLYGKL